MTKARAWPSNAALHRDSAAEELQDALRALEPIIDDDMTRTEEVTRIGRAIRSIQKALRWLERAGAPTIPHTEE